MPRASRIRVRRNPLTGRREEPLRARQVGQGKEPQVTVDFPIPAGAPKPTFHRDDQDRLWAINPHADVPMKLYSPDGQGGMNKTELEPNMPYIVPRGSEIRWRHIGEERYIPIRNHGRDAKGHWVEIKGQGEEKPRRFAVSSLGVPLRSTTPPTSTPRPSVEPMPAPPAPWASAAPVAPLEIPPGVVGRILFHPVHGLVEPHHAHFFVSGGNLYAARTSPGDVMHGEVGHTPKPLPGGKAVTLSEQDTIGIGPNVFKVREGNKLEIVQGPGKGQVIDVAAQQEKYFSIGSADDNHLILATTGSPVEPQEPRKRPDDLAPPAALPAQPAPGDAHFKTPPWATPPTAPEIPLTKRKGVEGEEPRADVHGKAAYGGAESIPPEPVAPAKPITPSGEIDPFARTIPPEAAPAPTGAWTELTFSRGPQQLFEHVENEGVAGIHARIDLSQPTGQGARLFADEEVLVKSPRGEMVRKKGKVQILLKKGTVFQIGQNVFEVKAIDQGGIILQGIDGPVKGRTFPLEGKEVSIGSGASADLRLVKVQVEAARKETALARVAQPPAPPRASGGLLDVLARGVADLTAGILPQPKPTREVPLLPAARSVRVEKPSKGQIVVTHEANSVVEPLHAVIEPAEEGLALSDNYTQEGVYVKKTSTGEFRRIEPGKAEQLSTGHYVRIGSNIFLVQSDGRETGQVEFIGIAGPVKGKEFTAPLGLINIGSDSYNQWVLKGTYGQRAKRKEPLVTPYKPPVEVPPEARISVAPTRVVGQEEPAEGVIEGKAVPGVYAEWAGNKERAAREKRAAARANLLDVLAKRAQRLQGGLATERVSIMPPARVVGKPPAEEVDEGRPTLVTIAPMEKEPELGEDEVVFRQAEHLRALLTRHMVLYDAVRRALQEGRISEVKVQSVDSMVRNASPKLDTNARSQLIKSAMQVMIENGESAALKHIEGKLAALLRDKRRSRQ